LLALSVQLFNWKVNAQVLSIKSLVSCSIEGSFCLSRRSLSCNYDCLQQVMQILKSKKLSHPICRSQQQTQFQNLQWSNLTWPNNKNLIHCFISSIKLNNILLCQLMHRPWPTDTTASECAELRLKPSFIANTNSDSHDQTLALKTNGELKK